MIVIIWEKLTFLWLHILLPGTCIKKDPKFTVAIKPEYYREAMPNLPLCIVIIKNNIAHIKNQVAQMLRAS